MEENKVVEKKNDDSFLKRYDTVMAFLGLEIIALTCFGLGGATGLTFLKILGFFISLGVVPFINANKSKEDLKKYWLTLIPVGVLAVLFGFSRFWFTAYGDGSSIVSVIVENLTITLGFAGFFLLAQGLKSIPSLKKEYIIYAFLGGLALISLVSIFYTIIRYGVFYAIRYSGKVYYYDGVLYSVSSEAKFLDGFHFSEVAINFALICPAMLACALPGCLLVSPSDKQKFYVLLSLGAVGLLSVILVFSPTMLILVALVYIVMVVFALLRKKELSKEGVSAKFDKAWNIIFIVVSILAVVVIAALLIMGNFFLDKKILSSSHFVEILNTMYKTFHQCTNVSADTWKFSLMPALLGESWSNYQLVGPGASIKVGQSRDIWSATLAQNGLIAFLLLVAGFIFIVYNARKFMKEDETFDGGKIALLGVGLMMAVYFSLFYTETPYAHNTTSFVAFSRTNFLLMMAFVTGYIYTPKKALVKEEGIKNE